MCASHILENVMEEITAANRGSSSRQKKYYQTAATLISNQHQRKNKQIINNSTYFLPHCCCGWEKHPKKHTSKNTNWPVAFRSFAKKHRSSFTTTSRRRKRSLRGQRHSLLCSPSTSRLCRLARPLSRPLRWSSLGGPTFPFVAAAAAAAASAAAVGWTEHRTKLRFHPHPQAISVFFIYFTYVS